MFDSIEFVQSIPPFMKICLIFCRHQTQIVSSLCCQFKYGRTMDFFYGLYKTNTLYDIVIQ